MIVNCDLITGIKGLGKNDSSLKETLSDVVSMQYIQLGKA